MQNTLTDRKDAPATGLARYICWQTVMALFCLAYMLLTLYGYYHESLYASLARSFAFPLTAGFAAIVLIQPAPRRRWDVRLLMLFWAWVLFVEIWNYEPGYVGFDFTIYHVLYYALVCFPLAMVLPDTIRRRVLHGVLHVFLLACAALCVISVYAALMQINIPSFNGTQIAGLDFAVDIRLNMFMHPNRAGFLCNLAIVLSIYLALSSKRWIVRVYCLLVALVAFTALALTDSRTNLIAVSVSVGMLGFLYIRKRFAAMPAVRRLLVGIACAAVATALCFFAFDLPVFLVGKAATALSQSTAVQEVRRAAQQGTEGPAGPSPTDKPVLMDMSNPEGTPALVKMPTPTPESTPTQESTPTPEPMPAPEAASEEGDLPIIIISEDQGEYALDQRPQEALQGEDGLDQPVQEATPDVQITQSRDVIGGLSNMGSRTLIWPAALEGIAQRPLLLLWGASYERSTDQALAHTAIPYAHLHSTVLQVLTSVGLPGLCLLVAFLVLLFISCLRLFRDMDPSTPLASRFLPVVLLSCMIVAMLESLLFMTDQRVFDAVFFIVAGFVTVLSAQVKQRRQDAQKNAAAPDEAEAGRA